MKDKEVWLAKLSTSRRDSVENASMTAVLLPASYERLRDVRIGRRKLVLKRWLAPVLLILSDVLLALLSWMLASALQGVWGRGSLSQVSAVAPVPLITAWVGVHACLKQQTRDQPIEVV